MSWVLGGSSQAQTTATPTIQVSPPDKGSGETDAPNADSRLRPFAEVIEGLQKQEGVFTVYSDLQQRKSYLAVRPDQLSKNFLLITTLESGLGEAGLYRGWPISDLLIQFREMPGDRLQVVVPNVYVRNPEGQAWQQRLLDGSFSDSAIFAIDVVSIDAATQTRLIDLSSFIMEKDVANLTQQLSWVLGGYVRNPDLSKVSSVKVFPQNLEIGTQLGFSGGATPTDPLAALFAIAFQGIPDDRGFFLEVRYSLSALPENHRYQPRVADERVGYFTTVFRAPLQTGQADPFVRYINRWHLEKQDPNAALSPPKQPIVFWVENTVPPEYRDAIAAGVLWWNEAFQQAGFENAIAVRQMPDDANWDPADVRYNVIRWSDSLSTWAFGIGPSRVNPLTGEILDADVILDANTIRILQLQFQARGLDSVPSAAQFLQRCGQRSQAWYLQWQAMQRWGEEGLRLTQNFDDTPGYASSIQLPDDQCAGYLNQGQLAFGALALSVLPGTNFSSDQLEAFVQQYLVALTAHEVGHTLGLRHNFAGSLLLAPEDLNNPEITRSQGMVSSIMDYFPPNVAPLGTPQGDFFPSRLGPYDRWAIEYGYHPAPAGLNPRLERSRLNNIVARSTQPELAYATDEDIYDFLDPETGAWDLSSDPLQYAIWQLDNAKAVWNRLNRLSVNPGEGYGSLRRRVDLVFRYFSNNALTLTDYIGGQRFRRLNPWETQRELTPFEPIPAVKQRQALTTLNEQVFAANAFEFSPQLINQLAPDRWRDWSSETTAYPLDYPIYDQVLELQSLVLSDLLLSERLARVRDVEFRTEQSDDVLTVSELFATLYQGIWTEITASTADLAPEISSLRRGLQRHHLNILTNLVLRRSFWDALEAQTFPDFMSVLTTLGAPEDARVLARYQLRQMYDDVGDILGRHQGRMDTTTQAHLEDVRDRIDRVLDAPLVGS
jgi:hypothetical protein